MRAAHRTKVTGPIGDLAQSRFPAEVEGAAAQTRVCIMSHM